MHDYTEAAATAIESGEREFAQRLLVDWNNNGLFDHPLSDLSGYTTSGKRDQVLTSTAPDEVMLIEGYAAGKLTVELTGEYNGLSLAAHFAPYNGRSVFYTEGIALGVSMTYELAVSTADGWEWWPQFVGVVQDVSTDREAGTVTIDCLDNVERLRTSVDVPPYALWQSYLQNTFKRGGLVDSSSIIDLAARSGGFTMGPARRWSYFRDSPRGTDYGPLLSVPFHGSVLPEIGMLDNDESFHLTEEWERSTDPATTARAEAYRAGPHGYLAHNAVPKGKNTWAYKKFWIDEFAGQAGTVMGTWVMGAWVYWSGPGVDENSVVIDMRARKAFVQLYVRGADGGVEARLQEPTGYIGWQPHPTVMTTPGWYYLEAQCRVESSAVYVLRVRVNDTYSEEKRYTGAATVDNTPDHLSGLVRIEHKFAVSDVYVVKANGLAHFANFSYDTKPADTARVSWGRNRVAYTLRETGREGWALAKEVSSAEYGVVFFDEFGRFVFWNYRDMTTRQQSPVRTFTLDDLESLSLRNTFDSIRNVWTVTTQTARAYNDIAYDLADGVPFIKDSRTGQLMPARFELPAYTGLGQIVFWFNVDDHTISLNPNDIWGLAVALGEFGPWEQGYPTFGLKSYTGTKYQPQPPHSEQKLTTRTLARLTMSNGLPEPVGFLLVRNPDRPYEGQPRFRLEGTMVHEDEPYTWSVRDANSVAEYGERVIELEGSFWLQDEYQTRSMLADIVERMGRPIPVSETLTVPGDPRIQIGDTIQVQDLDGFGERMWLQVYGIRREYGAEGLTDTYTVEMVTAAGTGIWDSPTYGLWDQSMIWS